MFNLFKKKEEKKPDEEVVLVPASPATEEKLVSTDDANPKKQSWWGKLTSGLQKSSAQLGDGITGIFTKKKLDDETLEALESLLIKADLGVGPAQKLTGHLRKTRFGKDISDEEIREALAQEIAALLQPVAQTLNFSAAKPFVMLMVGVNGVGKTTTMGKLAKQLQQEGKSVLLVAGDTFRAAAVSQLQVWAQRSYAKVISGAEGADPASLAYKGVEQARDEGADVVMIDTAGRLHNKADLMAELGKIVRVIKKMDPAMPHATLLVLDATTGQNALKQVEVFCELTPVSGLVLTKLDGSARGGVLVALAERFKLPVYAIGVGEGIDDLRPFSAQAFARALCGLGQTTDSDAS